ncbi:SprT family protein [Lactobacillus terrae]|uniref:SprT family protein n=1 Tax=Lactobacillus terrae TaxID=2269374 RepID=UPI000C1B6D8B|nr:SprT family protein [Lactobacillus terrae]
MTDKELTELIKKVSQNYFGKPFIHKANFNNRLQTTGGRFHLKDKHIDINPKILDKYGKDELIGVIKHELVHYHLYISGLPSQHKDKEFKHLLKKVGGSRYAPPMKSTVKSRTRHQYICSNCGLEYLRVKKIDTKRYVCGKCGGKLIFVKDINH